MSRRKPSRFWFRRLKRTPTSKTAWRLYKNWEGSIPRLWRPCPRWRAWPPTTRADDSTYFRRVNLDLIGRIPGLTEHRDFLDNDDPSKRWEWVERLLGEDKSHPDFLDKHVKNFASILRMHILGSNVQPQFAGLAPGFEQWLGERLKGNAPYNRIVQEILNSGPN